MSAIHHGYFAAHRRPDGSLVIDYATNSSTAGFWRDADPRALNEVPNPEVHQAEAETPRPIPAQRAGSTYEQVVLDTQTDDLADLSDLVPIPSLTAFAKSAPTGEVARP